MSVRQLDLTSAADIQPKPVRWLWRGYLPMGKITVLAGAPGLGKSLLTMRLAQRVSRVANVLIASAEDDPEDTIVPRLMAAGANRDRVHLLDVRELGDNGLAIPGIVQLPDDAAQIHHRAKETGAGLVILDPVAAFIGGDHSAYREQDVRAALAPMKVLAEDTRAAVLLVMHLNKGDGSDPLRRIGNSGAFTALARSVLVFGSDPEDEDGDRGVYRVLTVAKGNVRGSGRGSLRMRIVTRPVEAGSETIEMATLEEVGESHVTAEDLLSTGEERTAKGEAMVWLRAQLADGSQPAREIQARARDEGIAKRTLDRAKSSLGVNSNKATDGHWIWSLPATGGDVGVLPVDTEGTSWRPSENGWQPCPEDAKNAKSAKQQGVEADEAEERRAAALLKRHADLAEGQVS